MLVVVPRLTDELTVASPKLSDEERALLTFVSWCRRLDWKMGFVAVIAGLHLVGAFTLTFAPHNQLFTQGTRPVFELLPTTVWAVWFLVAGSAAASLLFRVTGFRQMLAWLTVLPSQTVWIGASFMAVTRGGGSAMGAVFLTAVLAFTAITAIVVALDYTSGKR